MTCLSKVSVTLPETTVTLLKGRQTLVSPVLVHLGEATRPAQPPLSGLRERPVATNCGCGYARSSSTPRLVSVPSSCLSVCQVEGQKVTLPIMPAKGVFVGPSGRFVELKTVFGLRVRWDGEQQLFVTVSR